MGYFRVVLVLVVLTIFCISCKAARCPPPNWIKPTRPCISDKECYPGLCCPDIQGRKSCALPQGSGGHGLAKHAGSTGGVMCDGVKCRPHEVCKADLISKRRRCHRA